jgi:hypothetical protein
MRSRCLLLALLFSSLICGCLLPAQGTPVYVDMRAGRFWSGEARLLEVSDDQKRCRVSVRQRTLVVRTLWVHCVHVHAKSVRDRTASAAKRRAQRGEAERRRAPARQAACGSVPAGAIPGRVTVRSVLA